MVEPQPEPEPPGPVAAVAAGYYHFCALGTDGDTYCWGQNVSGSLGNGTTSGGDWYIASRVVGGHTFSSLTSAEFYTCGLEADGSAYCWGSNSQSVLGRGPTPGDGSIPGPVAGDHSFGQLAGGEDFICGLETSRDAYCWGWNAWGQLGVGDTIEVHDTPTAVVGGIEFSSLAAGYRHACGVSVDGDAYCWGKDGVGALGHGAQVGTSLEPLLVVGGLEFAQLSVGFFFSCGLTVEGEAYCWGSNANASGEGYLGNTTIASSTQPVAVAGNHIWLQIDAGPYHTCGVTTDHDAYCWGAEWEIFQTTSGRLTAEPFPIPGGHKFASVSSGFMTTCGVRADGELFCWGMQYGDDPFRLSILTAGPPPEN